MVPGFGVATVFGALFGAFIAAKQMGRFQLTTFSSIGDTKRNLVGAALMGIGGVMVIDLVTFGVAMLTLLLVQLPTVERGAEATQGESFLQQVSFGWRYILARKGLLGLMLIFAGIEFFRHAHLFCRAARVDPQTHGWG
ncbi:MAG: YeeE/YedE family protein [Aquincola sp.]|nr:YeeE/YedE family protein [Aquincola sp.]